MQLPDRRTCGHGFNLARVPADFNLEPNELFDPEYMRALFERGVAAGRDETSWIRQEALTASPGGGK
jgi:hypothetical protein